MGRRTTHVLFVCDANRLRSPSAAQLYGREAQLETRAVGLDRCSVRRIAQEDLEWADLIFVMERRQRNKIHKLFPDLWARKRIICLYIPDEYDFMEPALLSLLETKLAPYLGRPISEACEQGIESTDEKEMT